MDGSNFNRLIVENELEWDWLRFETRQNASKHTRHFGVRSEIRPPCGLQLPQHTSRQSEAGHSRSEFRL